ncbi:helix-turn-helix transcriptional regulator [Vallitalea okinawensis]|uniref:helix-turn-helix transcriptional regulator n=1 Tax=Vallitalea okinawensis TaxID=2078660 RepID=UPI000CFD5AE5|nr:AraC family transcriptional regulator [Vallitalea okinawensis]
MNRSYFNLSSFIKNKPYLNAMHVREDYGRYSIDIGVGDYIRFDETPTNHQHSHSIYEICLVLDGTGLFRHGEEVYEVNRGTLFLANPNVVHEISSFDTRDLYLVFFTFDIVMNVETLAQKYEDHIIEDFIKSHQLVMEDVDILFHYLPLLNNKYMNKELSSRLFNEYSALKALVFEFICLLTNDQMKNSYYSSNEKLNTVIEYINNHIHTKLKVEEVAKKHYMSERNLRRLFKKYYNQSVHVYINQRKMKIASSKLLMGFQVSEAARAIGIEDVSYFSRCFKKEYGVSPRDYKKNH